jgi:hypothetical protein
VSRNDDGRDSIKVELGREALMMPLPWWREKNWPVFPVVGFPTLPFGLTSAIAVEPASTKISQPFSLL